MVRALGLVLAHQLVGVLVRASLPRAVWVTEVHRNVRASAQFPVHRLLPALVVRHALAHRLSEPQQLVREGLQDIDRAGGLEPVQLDEHEQPDWCTPPGCPPRWRSQHP